MADFWCIVNGISYTVIVCSLVYGASAVVRSYRDRRDHARYRRRQQDRVNRGVGYIHNGHNK